MMKKILLGNLFALLCGYFYFRFFSTPGDPYSAKGEYLFSFFGYAMLLVFANFIAGAWSSIKKDGNTKYFAMNALVIFLIGAGVCIGGVCFNI